MDVDSNTWALEDAFACISQQFVEPEGLLARVGRGEEIHPSQVELITKAFRTIHSAWQGKEVVPGEAVRVVSLASSSISRLEQYIQAYPQHKDEIEQVLSQLHEWIEMVFLPPARSEEVALSLVNQHLLGTSPFTTELLHGRINDDSLGELINGLAILGQAWQTRENIPKLAAYAMLCVPWDFDEASQHFSGSNLQRLHEIGQQVMESIMKCLS